MWGWRICLVFWRVDRGIWNQARDAAGRERRVCLAGQDDGPGPELAVVVAALVTVFAPCG
jgi:hypothetical protein